MESLDDRLENENESESDHGDGSDPGDHVEEESVGVLTHEVPTVDDEKNKDDDYGEPKADADLREEE